MKPELRKWHVFQLVLLLILASVIPGRAASDVLADNAPKVLEKKTFKRWPDPVVADVALFASLLGKNIDFLRLYAFQEGAFQPIPFQVDEKDAEGNLVFPSGKDANPEDANGLVDKGEELVFMARDCGDRVDPQAFLSSIEIWEEIELEDPLTSEKGWVYLLYAESDPPPLSDEDYFIYKPAYQNNPERDCLFLHSKYFEARQYPQGPYFDTSDYDNCGFAHWRLTTPPEAGGTNVDFSDRYKVRVTLAFLFGALKFHFDENDITFYENAYKDGPVRLIRNDKLILSLPLGIKAPGAEVNAMFYDTITDTPLIIDIPFNPGYIYTYLEFSIAEDLSRDANGMRAYNSNNLKGCLVDGKMDGEAEKKWNTGKDNWRLAIGKQGTVMKRSIWDESFLEQMKELTVTYSDDLAQEDPPEEEPGTMGMMRETARLEKIERGRYNSYQEWYYPPLFLFTGPDSTYRPGDEKHYLNMADHPVRLRVGEAVMESHYLGQIPPYEQEEEQASGAPEKETGGRTDTKNIL